MGIKAKSPMGKAVWCSLAEKDNFGKYNVKVAFPESADLSAIEDAVEQARLEKFGVKTPKNYRHPIMDGNEETDDDGNVYEHSKDMRIIRFSTTNPVRACGPGGGADVIEPGDIFAGCYVKVSTDAYAYDSHGNKGVSLALEGVQLYKLGERIGGGAPIVMEDEFGAAEEGDDEEW